MGDDQVRKEEAATEVFPPFGAFGDFISPSLYSPNGIQRYEHKPNHYLDVNTQEMIQPAHVSFWEDSEDPNYSESEKSVRLEVRGLHLKSAERESLMKGRMKFLGLLIPLKTITVKLTTFLLPSFSLTVLIGNAIRSFLPHFLLRHEVAY